MHQLLWGCDFYQRVFVLNQMNEEQIFLTLYFFIQDNFLPLKKRWGNSFIHGYLALLFETQQ